MDLKCVKCHWRWARHAVPLRSYVLSRLGASRWQVILYLYALPSQELASPYLTHKLATSSDDLAPLHGQDRITPYGDVVIGAVVYITYISLIGFCSRNNGSIRYHGGPLQADANYDKVYFATVLATNSATSPG